MASNTATTSAGTAGSSAGAGGKAATSSSGGTQPAEMEDDNLKEIYTYKSQNTIYAMNWSVKNDKRFRLAVGSFVEEYSNKVELVELDFSKDDFVQFATFDHPYPPTKIMWNPERNSTEDLIATTGDYLRVWQVKDDHSVVLRHLLDNNRHNEFCAPLTSFDWNEYDASLIGTASIDTTCTIWNVETGQAKTQLIAHDKEVYGVFLLQGIPYLPGSDNGYSSDIAFARGVNVFASVGADGSVRMFDLRSLDHSTIIYETSDHQPLLRLAWNKQDPNYLATIPMDSKRTVILDIRVASLPVAELDGHDACVNGIAWAPHSSCHICTAGDDSQALIWDLSSLPKPVEDPILVYQADGEINQLQWSAAHPDWVAITYGDRMQILRV